LTLKEKDTEAATKGQRDTFHQERRKLQKGEGLKENKRPEIPRGKTETIARKGQGTGKICFVGNRTYFRRKRRN